MLKFSYRSLLFAMLPILPFFFPYESYAYEFVCGSVKGFPVTVAETARGDIPVIYWISNDLSGSWTPQKRCEDVSQKFQAAQDNQQLEYLSSGVINGQQVICTSNRFEGNCINVLFTLKATDDPKKILLQLLDLRGLANGQAIEQSEYDRIYIDFEEYLNRIPALR